MTGDKDELRLALTPLIRQKLSVARRAADMRVLHFGTLRPAPKSDIPLLKNKPRGSIGDFVLHIQCPWRIETEDSILTGRSDLWEPCERPDGFSYADWDYERDGNLQDQLLDHFFLNNDKPVVESVSIQSNCAFTLAISGGYRLVVFPSGSIGEDWRLFRPGTEEPHLVVSGGAIERDDS